MRMFLRGTVATCVLLGLLISPPAHAANNNTVVVRVVGPDGAPIARASVGYSPGCDAKCGPYFTDDTGVFRAMGVPDGEHLFFAGASGLVGDSQQVQSSGGSTMEVVLHMTIGGSIRVTDVPRTPTPMGPAYLGWIIPVAVNEQQAAKTPSSGTVVMAGVDATEITGLATGDYKVLFFVPGMSGVTSMRRAWYGGGALKSSARSVRVIARETVSIAAPDIPDSTSLPALPPPEVEADTKGYAVTVRDPEGIGIQLGYDLEVRSVTRDPSTWSSGGAVEGEPRQFKVFSPEQVAGNPGCDILGPLPGNTSGWCNAFGDLVGTPGDTFEFRVRATGAGVWSDVVSSESARARLTSSAYALVGAWSTAKSVAVPPPKGSRPSRPRVLVVGNRRVMVWGAVPGAASYEVQKKRRGKKWGPMRIHQSKTTRLRLKKLVAGTWRFKVRGRNSGGVSRWSRPSRPLTVH